MMTQSVGVPRSANLRSEIWRRRKGSLSDSECASPLWSISGAIVHMSSESPAAIRSMTSSPGA